MGEVFKEKKMINTSLICTDDYQRPVRDGWVKTIIKNFEEIQADAPKVSFRDGKYYLFDGQHTLTARVLMNEGENLDVECEVYYGLTKEDEAKLFVKLNSNKKSVTFNERMKSSYIAGDELTRAIIDTIEKCGFTVDYKGNLKSGSSFSSLSKITQIWKKDGADCVVWILDVVKNCWPENKNGSKGPILGGLQIIYNVYSNDPNFSKSDFINAMKEESPVLIVREGREKSIGGDKRFARRMILRYNNVRKNINAKTVYTYKLDR